jgi:hypothetical protein
MSGSEPVGVDDDVPEPESSAEDLQRELVLRQVVRQYAG